jgi:hypothetical protein
MEPVPSRQHAPQTRQVLGRAPFPAILTRHSGIDRTSKPATGNDAVPTAFPQAIDAQDKT